MNPSKIVQVTTSGDVTTDTAFIRGVVLTAGDAAAATATVIAGGSAGTTVLTVKAGTGETVTAAELHSGMCVDGIYVGLSGSSAVATVVYA